MLVLVFSLIISGYFYIAEVSFLICVYLKFVRILIHVFSMLVTFCMECTQLMPHSIVFQNSDQFNANVCCSFLVSSSVN